MTGDEAVTAVRANFGEASAVTVTDATIQAWIIQAVMEVFGLLPPGELRPRVVADTVSITSGQGSLDTDWDEVLAVHTDEAHLLRVEPEVIRTIDTRGTYAQPDTAVYALVANEIFVRPASLSTVTVEHTEQPAEISNFVTELATSAGIPLQYQPAVVNLASSYAYAQEEDREQAQWYRDLALTRLGAATPTDLPTPEAEPQGAR